MANLKLNIANTRTIAEQILEADQSMQNYRSDDLLPHFDQDQRATRGDNIKFWHRRVESRLKKHGSETSSGADLTYAMDQPAEEPWRRDP